MRFLYFLFLFIVFFSSCNKKNDTVSNTDNLKNKDSLKISSNNYQKVSTEQSGLKFNNAITHNLASKENLFDFDFFYNGAGVGVEDINNDGLKDIFFCGNQVPNKLFLNKGNLVFEDISATANINTNKNWSSGVTFADVNNDGWMDIYVSQGGPKSKKKERIFSL